MFKRIIKLLKTFIVGYVCVFVFVIFLAKFTGFSSRDPIVLSWDEVFNEYLGVVLILPLIFSLIAVYGKWDDKKF